jgi:hypothetical protein
MKRSDFLKNLIASVAIGKLPVALTKDFRKIYLLQCFVAGFRFYEGMNRLEDMKDGDLLELIREPENSHDTCAIALHWQGKKIGYIPASINEMLSYLLDAEALSLFAVITHLEHESQPWENVAAAVYFIQEVNKELPAHASYLTRIEAPHYRTLNNKQPVTKKEKQPTLDDLFENTNRALNLDTIPANQKEAKNYFEKYYSKYPVAINKAGRYVQVKDDGIFSYMYEIEDNIELVRTKSGEEFLEFFLE